MAVCDTNSTQDFSDKVGLMPEVRVAGQGSVSLGISPTRNAISVTDPVPNSACSFAKSAGLRNASCCNQTEFLTIR